MKSKSVLAELDWLSVLLYLILVIFGWVCIYATNYDETAVKFFDFDTFHTKQIIFVATSLVLIPILLNIEPKFYERFSSLFFLVSILLLIGVLFFGKKINGAVAWYAIGPVTIQPSEFAKTATALVFAKEVSRIQTNLRNLKTLFRILSIIILPCILIILQPDPGSVLVYTSFVFALHREGMNPVYLFIAGLCAVVFLSTLKFGLSAVAVLSVVFCLIYAYLAYERTQKIPIRNVLTLFLISLSVAFISDKVYHDVFKEHHRNRFSIWLRLENDITKSAKLMQNEGYNTHQSESAISSGGLSGKGFLQGTRTKGSFVPEQHTDYIFTTLGEEWGFYGTASVVLIFSVLLLRLWYIAERQHSKFSRTYGYCVVGIIFMHFLVNIGMAIGLLPTIGIPLPFFSYGGSSLWGFTILLFILLRLDADRKNSWHD